MKSINAWLMGHEDNVWGLEKRVWELARHCESGEGLWLQGEAAFQMHSFRDADPQPVIPQNLKKIWNILLVAETRHKYQPDHH